jgi:hypothetical protein
MSEEKQTFDSGPEVEMRENARRLDQQAEVLTRMAFDTGRAGDSPMARYLTAQAEAARDAVQRAANELRSCATLTERFGEIVSDTKRAGDGARARSTRR